MQLLKTCSFTLCRLLQGCVCERPWSLAFSSEDESQLANVIMGMIVCVCKPPSPRVVYGLVAATFLHSAASEQHIPAREREEEGDESE